MSYQTLCTVDTGFCADTVEWCPVEPLQDVLVCGTYQLVQANSQIQSDVNETAPTSNVNSQAARVGNVQVFQLDKSRENLQKISTLPKGAGILDMKWYPHMVNESAVLGAVSAESELKIYTLSNKGDNISMIEQAGVNVGPEKICLSLDWSSRNNEQKCMVSDSQGQLTLLQCCDASWEPRQIMQWTGHDYEAWITAFDRWSPHVVYSGGDDCRLKGWDTRTDCTQPIFNSRKHEMGVSSIQCNPVHEYILATGSYDENILVWDTRSMKIPLCSSNPGGGVWRIKWHPLTGCHILTATMYDGFHVLKYYHEKDSHNVEVLISYKENYQLAYGADWCRTSIRECGEQCSKNDCDEVQSDKPAINTTRNLVATCSFYDHILHLWDVHL